MPDALIVLLAVVAAVAVGATVAAVRRGIRSRGRRSGAGHPPKRDRGARGGGGAGRDAREAGTEDRGAPGDAEENRGPPEADPSLAAGGSAGPAPDPAGLSTGEGSTLFDMEAVEPPGHDLRFTVYRPGVALPERWYDLLVFMHELELPSGRLATELPPRERIEREARRILGGDASAYVAATEDAAAAVPRAGQLTFVVELPGFRVNPPRQTVSWYEEIQHVRFRIRAEPARTQRTARGRLTVFHGPLILAEMSLVIAVGQGDDRAVSEPLTPYRKIFASYAREDDGIVHRLGAFAASVGDRYLRDVTSLRTAEEWNPGLARLIEEADIFQLFWSWNAMDSDWVRREWTHALSLGRAGFVRPVYWEDPLPRRPTEGLPPPELSRLHFHRLPETLVEGPRHGDVTAGEAGASPGRLAAGPRGSTGPMRSSTPPRGRIGRQEPSARSAPPWAGWRSVAVWVALVLGVGAGGLWLGRGAWAGAGPTGVADVAVSGDEELGPPGLRLVVGDTVTLTATPSDRGGAALDRPVSWRSRDPEVASVDGNGRVVAVGDGSTRITAVSEGVARDVAVTVTPPPSEIVVRTAAGGRTVDAPLRLAPGESVDLDAGVLDDRGRALPGSEVTWSAQPPAVVAVDAAGVVSARAAGDAVITARIRNVEVTVPVTVRPPGLTPPPTAP